MVPYVGGYGYRIKKGERADAVIAAGPSLLLEHKNSVDWVLAEFGSHGSSDLELESTIIYADREAARKAEKLTLLALAQRVKEVKPHFAEEYILEKTAGLYAKQLQESASPALAHAWPAANSKFRTTASNRTRASPQMWQGAIVVHLRRRADREWQRL